MFEGKIAEEYDSWYRTSPGNFIDFVETRLAFDLFEPTASSKILDAGCGTGNFSKKLADKSCQMIGIDISAQMLEIARQKNKNDARMEFMEMNLYQLNFPDQYFDGVFSMAAFEFIDRPQAAYKELYRVLKPGGQLLIGTINRDSDWGEHYLKDAAQDPRSVFNYAHFMTPADLAELNPKELTANRGCLFVPPGEKESQYRLEREKALEGMKRPGFIIALWQKQ